MELKKVDHSGNFEILLAGNSGKEEEAAIVDAFQACGLECALHVADRADAALAMLSPPSLSLSLLLVSCLLPKALEVVEGAARQDDPVPCMLLCEKGTEGVAQAALRAGGENVLIRDPERAYLQFLPAMAANLVRRHREARACRETREKLRQSEQNLKNLAQRNELILEAAGAGIFGIDRSGRFTFVNAAAAQMLGYGQEELIGQDSHSLCHHTTITGEAYPRGDCPVYAAFRENRTYQVSSDIFWRKDRISFPVEYVSSPLREEGEVSGAVLVFRDIRERTQAEAVRRESRRHLSEVIQASPLATFVIDKCHLVTNWNRACERMTGITADEMVGTRGQWRTFYPGERPTLADLIVDDVSAETICEHYGDKARRSSLIEGAYEAEDFFESSGRWLFFTAAPLRDAGGNIVGAIETLQDITERKSTEAALRESERRYRELSITDSLTGLYNPRHFYSQLCLETTRATRYGSSLALLLIDVDNFKNYNDTYGHLEGDKVLRVLAGVLRLFLRSTDSGYRYGGEEFIVILPETDLAEALVVAERLRLVFAEMAFSPAPGRTVHVTISIGVDTYRAGEEDADFIRRADEHVYLAKQLGKNRVESGDPTRENAPVK